MKTLNKIFFITLLFLSAGFVYAGGYDFIGYIPHIPVIEDVDNWRAKPIDPEVFKEHCPESLNLDIGDYYFIKTFEKLKKQSAQDYRMAENIADLRDDSADLRSASSDSEQILVLEKPPGYVDISKIGVNTYGKDNPPKPDADPDTNGGGNGESSGAKEGGEPAATSSSSTSTEQSTTSAPETRVVEITTWGNNCALSCTAIFLVNKLLSKELSPRGAQNFTNLFNEYYKTSLTVEQLRDFFRKVSHPAARQVIVGPVLREFITSGGIRAEDNGMLSNEAFKPMAEEFEFNVQFYAEVGGKIDISGAIPAITINPTFRLTFRPYYHASHYDLIMDTDDDAKSHNDSPFKVCNLEYSIEKDNEEQTIRFVQTRADEILRLLGEIKLQIGSQIESFKELAKSLREQGEEDMAEKADAFADWLTEQLISRGGIEDLVSTINRQIIEEERGIPQPSWWFSWITPAHSLKNQLDALRALLKKW